MTTSTLLPATCRMALKEWASVLMALERGEQLVLIRKGGLIEPGSGFELLSDVFVFYPTFEHQTVNFVRPAYASYLPEALARRAPEGQVRVEWCAKAVASVQSKNPAIINRLSAFHIYNDAFQTQRLKWQPDQPLAITIVRVFRLVSPQLLPVSPRYAGCKSWVELDTELSLGGAAPAMPESTFSQHRATLQTLLECA